MSARENDGERLVAALEAAGFTTVNPGRGYIRMGWPGSEWPHGTLMVPTDDTAPEFAEMLAALKATLTAAVQRGEAARLALDLHRTEAER